MSRNNKSSKAEGIIVLIIFLIGAFGAFYLFSGQEETVSDPSQSIEVPAGIAQVSSQKVHQ